MEVEEFIRDMITARDSALVARDKVREDWKAMTEPFLRFLLDVQNKSERVENVERIFDEADEAKITFDVISRSRHDEQERIPTAVFLTFDLWKANGAGSVVVNWPYGKSPKLDFWRGDKATGIVYAVALKAIAKQIGEIQADRANLND